MLIAGFPLIGFGLFILGCLAGAPWWVAILGPVIGMLNIIGVVWCIGLVGRYFEKKQNKVGSPKDIEYLGCPQKISTLRDLPREKRSIKLRYEGIKSRVCAPYRRLKGSIIQAVHEVPGEFREEADILLRDSVQLFSGVLEAKPRDLDYHLGVLIRDPGTWELLQRVIEIYPNISKSLRISGLPEGAQDLAGILSCSLVRAGIFASRGAYHCLLRLPGVRFAGQRL